VFGCGRAGPGGNELGYIGLTAKGETIVETPSGFVVHHSCALAFGMSLGKRKLHALVRTDGPAIEDLPIRSVGNGHADRQIHRAYKTCNGNDPLGVEHVEKLRPGAMQGAEQFLWINVDTLEKEFEDDKVLVPSFSIGAWLKPARSASMRNREMPSVFF
jgi:hypothetical protein